MKLSPIRKFRRNNLTTLDLQWRPEAPAPNLRERKITGEGLRNSPILPIRATPMTHPFRCLTNPEILGRCRLPIHTGLLCATATFIVCLAGCSGDGASRPNPEARQTGESLFGGGGGSGDASIATNPAADAWSIVIVAFYDRDPYTGEPLPAAQLEEVHETARLSLHKVQTSAGLRNAYLARQGKSLVLSYGRYPSFDTPAAQADLRRIQNMVIEGERPFASALLVPPDGADIGTMPEFDLRTVKSRFGSSAVYTLQVGVYSREDGRPMSMAERADIRKSAEQAVVELRRQGELAFYYHGPNRSMVTIGIFGEEDNQVDAIDGRVTQSHDLLTLRQRHPLNLLNGRGIRQRVPNIPESDPNAWRLQPSGLVMIPES